MSLSPIFLNLQEVLQVHRDQIERYGGLGGVRDSGLLQSALAAPAAGFGGGYLHSDLCEMAAAYLFHIVSNHPFLDGNKRTGLAAALLFLYLTEVKVQLPAAETEALVLAVATRRVGRAEVAGFLRRHAIP